MHPRDMIDTALARKYREDAAADTLAAPLTDKEWILVQRLLTRGQGGLTPRHIDRAVALISHTRRTYSGTPTTTASRDPLRGELRALHARRVTHEGALAACLFDHARGNREVVAFRRDVLGGRPLTRGFVARWVETQSRTEGAPSVRTLTDGRRGVNLLVYRRPGSGDVVHVPVQGDGVLERLRRLGEALTDAYGWEPSDATQYVLTDEMPRINLIRAEIRRKFPVAARSSILLTIHPMCTAREVAAAYRRWRRLHFGRLRRLSQKHATLAMFALENADLPVVDRMHQWNARHRRQKYRRAAIFARDSQAALHRLRELGTLGP